MIIGYARVSGEDQHLELQIDALTQAGCEKIFTDKVSGKNDNREGLKNCIEFARSGDTLIVWRLDRLGRSLTDLIRIVNGLQGKEVKFKSLHEVIDTSSPVGKLTFHIFAALAEFERCLIVERTQAGLQSARARGHYGGRPKKITGKEKESVLTMLTETKMTVKDIASIFGASRQTLYRMLKEEKKGKLGLNDSEGDNDEHGSDNENSARN